MDETSEEKKDEGEVWSAEGKSQDDFMMKDECIILNYNDDVIGHDNKYNAHKFIVGQPKGMLHRAFSVMLFDSEGKLLLQQRASTKITFADVWTNTCCSHPLHGMKPDEVDAPEATEEAQLRTKMSKSPDGAMRSSSARSSTATKSSERDARMVSCPCESSPAVTKS